MSVRHVAVLGAGILGASVALWLARRGVRVTLFDAGAQPLAAASRWNEGKIHLGHLYSADPGLGTARRLLPGGLRFRPLLEGLIGTDLAPAITDHDDTYLVHRDSVASAAAMAAYLEAVTALAREHPDARHYLADLRRARMRPLDARERAAHCDGAHVVAAFRVPERSVDTQWVADRLVDALRAEPRITLYANTRVDRVEPARADLDGPLHVHVHRGDESQRHGPFDAVVNALWEGRLAVDASLGLAPPAEHTHRFRLSLFATAPPGHGIVSTVIATGPFGDVKAYPGGRLYLSWYASGLLAQGTQVAPPPLPALDPARCAAIAGDVLHHLARILPAVANVDPRHARVEGGWVYAVGQGRLDEATSALHRRDRIGIARHGRYFSVDTGKYSIAPWLALQVADALTQ